MKHLRLLAVALLAPMMASTAMAGSPTFYDTTYTSALGTMKYRVYTPADYDPNGAAIPVVLYLHSAAERGTGPDSGVQQSIFYNGNNWAPQLVNATQAVNSQHQAVVIMPLSGWYQNWATVNVTDQWSVGDYTDATQGTINPRLQLAMDILNVVTTTKNVDTNRLYITGPSMGGYGTWDAISRFPNLFAAAAPLAGGGNLDAAARLADMPIWQGHGAQDPLISVNNDDQLNAALLAAGGNPLYSRIASGDHGNWWDEFYTNDYYTTASPSAYSGSGIGLYDWMFAQTLAVPEPTSFAVLGIVGGMMGMSRRRRQTVTA